MSLSRIEKRGCAAIAGLYLVTAFMGAHFIPEVPQVWNGDEPHYLLMLTSLIEDGDLDLGNNYRDVHRGGLAAGRRFSGSALDHQTTWWAGQERVAWSETFELDRAKWARDADGHPVPVFVPGHEREMAGVVERPIHPPGLPWMIAPFVWPFARTRLAEPLALLAVTLMVLLAALLFLRMVRPWATSPAMAVWVMAAAFLGTPVWRYSRSLFTEGPLTLCAIGAYALVLSFSSPIAAWGAGLLLAWGALMKPPFLLLAVPLGVLLLARREWSRLLGLVAPSAAGFVGALATNVVLYGGAGRAPQPFVFGNPAAGLWGLLFSQWRGLFWFAPIAMAAVWSWPRFWRRHPVEARTLLAGALLYLGLMACWSVWDGGLSYGPRLIVPVIPFTLVGLLGVDLSNVWQRRTVFVLGFVSFVISFLAAGPMAHVREQNLLVAAWKSMN